MCVGGDDEGEGGARRCRLRLDRACLLMGFAHFVVSAGVFAAAVVLLAGAGGPLQAPGGPLQAPGGPPQAPGGPPQAPGGPPAGALGPRALHCVLWGALLAALASMLSAAMLVLGVQLRVPGLVVWYVGWGAFAALCGPLAALLLVLQAHWLPALLLLAACAANVRSALSAHAMYEALQKGRQFGFGAHEALHSGGGGAGDAGDAGGGAP